MTRNVRQVSALYPVHDHRSVSAKHLDRVGGAPGGIEPPTSSSGEDSRPPGANYLVLTKVDADLASSAEQWTAQGPVVLPVFIRQGWLEAMIHLPWNNREPLTLSSRCRP
jgi:hypothetical protein